MPQLPPSPFDITHIGLVDDYIRDRRKDGNWEYPYTDIDESEMVDGIRALGGFSEKNGHQVLSDAVAQQYTDEWYANNAG